MLVTIISIVLILMTIIYLWRETQSYRNILNKKRVEPFVISDESRDTVEAINQGATKISNGICSGANLTDRPNTILTLNELSREITDGLQQISDNVSVYHKSLL